MNLSDITDSFRKALVEVLVPEIRLLREDNNKQFAKMDERFTSMQKQMDERFTKADERFEKLFEIVIETRMDVKYLKTRDEMNQWISSRVDRLENNMEKVQQRLAAA